jgi:hypothetical protein
MIYIILNLLLLLGCCLFCSVLVFVINFLGFAVQFASISTKHSPGCCVGAQLVSPKTAIFYMYFFTSITYLATLDVIGFVLGLQSNFRPALQSAYRLIPNIIYFDYYFLSFYSFMGPF